MSRLLLVFSLVLAPVISPQEKPEEAAQQAGAGWLALVDSGKYAESWKEAAEIFKSRITQEQWAARVKQGRDQVGAFKERRVKSATYSEKLPNAPAGRYVVIQYDAVYESGKFTETLVPTEEGGRWKVSGYFIKPAQ
jgi:hypothetical protein